MDAIDERRLPSRKVNIPLQARYKGRIVDMKLRLLRGRYGLVQSPVELEVKKQMVLNVVPTGNTALDRVQLFARVERNHPSKGLVELRWNKAVSPMGLKHLTVFLNMVLFFQIPRLALPDEPVSLKQPSYFDFARTKLTFPGLVATPEGGGESIPELVGRRPSSVQGEGKTAKGRPGETRFSTGTPKTGNVDDDTRYSKDRLWEMLGKLDVSASTHHQGSKDAKGVAYRMAQQAMREAENNYEKRKTAKEGKLRSTLKRLRGKDSSKDQEGD